MRLAFVVQRYGMEVNGGAEVLCRWVAERMRKYFEVEVLTTCALDYLSWDNHFSEGETTVNAVTVRRFPTDASRDMKQFNTFARTLFASDQRPLVDELTWLKLQGPYSSSLLTYIKEHEFQYDLFIFVTYSYLTTFLGLQIVPRKSLLIPAAHDEPHFYFTACQPIFHLPAGIIYNTSEERRLVHEQWHNETVPWCVAGIGIEETETQATMLTTDTSYEHFPPPYLLYAGRVDVMKGCRELLTYFLRYVKERQNDLHLLLLGKQTMEIPQHPNIHAPGFVTAFQKSAAFQEASLVINPSEYESLSLLLLEGWQAGVPALVNGRSDVLAEHCLASNGGLYYTNYDEFAFCLDLMLTNQPLREKLGAQGKAYVADRYSWDTVEKTYVDFITQIANV